MSASRRTTSIWSANLKKWKAGNLKVTENPWTATCTVPGLSHESFDREGNPKMTSLMQTSVISRMYAFHTPYNESGSVFVDWPKVTADRLSFISSSEFRMSRAMYNPDVVKWPLHMKCCLGYVGNSTVAFSTEFFSPDVEKEPILTQLNQVVSIDKKIRKSLALPPWFRDKYVDKGIWDRGLFIKAFERPENTFVYDVTVSWSDTDNYNHTNFTSYVMYAVNALHSALLHFNKTDGGNQTSGETASGTDNIHPVIRGMTEEIVSRGMKNLQISYQNESLEGQNMKVHIWQLEGEDFVVRCSIERGHQVVCQLRMEYFDELSSSSS